VTGNHQLGLQSRHLFQLRDPRGTLGNGLGVGGPHMHAAEHADVADDGLDRQNPGIGAVCQRALRAADFDGLVSKLENGAFQ
jgi:hypothetical protein